MVARRRIDGMALVLFSLACGSGLEPGGPKQPSQSPSLTVNSGISTLSPGGGFVITFSATLTGSAAPISWSLSPLGVGTLSATIGSTTNLTLPASLTGITTITVTATAGSLTADNVVHITVEAPL